MVVMYKDNGVNCHYLKADKICTEPFLLGIQMLRRLGLALWSYAIECSPCGYRLRNNIPIGKFATDVHFEGGDFLILEAGMALIGHCGERSEAAGSE